MTYNPVREPTGITDSILLSPEILQGTVVEVAVAGMHGDDPMLHTIKHFQRILTGENRIGRIMVNAKPWRIDLFDDRGENIHLLREFGITPIAILIMIFHRQNDPMLLRTSQKALNHSDDLGDAGFNRYPGAPLAGQNTTETPAKEGSD